MVTTVELQNPFEYSLWVSILAAVFILMAIGLLAFIVIKALFFNKPAVAPAPVPVNAPVRTNMVQGTKNQYIQRVQDIKNRYAAGAVSKRVGYQELSAVVREFVHAATGINVENLTAAEIKGMGIGMLDVLMEEYYVPEFAEDERAKKKNLSAACDKTEGVIRAWN